MSARIVQAAELVVRTMLGQDGTAAGIVQALADANLLQAVERPAAIADQAEVIALQKELTEALEAHRAYAAGVEDDLAKLGSLRLMSRRLQESTAAAVAETGRLRGALRDISGYCRKERCEGQEDDCPSELARQALRASASTEVTVWRAERDGIPLGTYTTAPAGRAHCEADHNESDWRQSPDWTPTWQQVGEDAPHELWMREGDVDSSEEQTPYLVVPVAVAEAYDPDGAE